MIVFLIRLACVVVFLVPKSTLPIIKKIFSNSENKTTFSNDGICFNRRKYTKKIRFKKKRGGKINQKINLVFKYQSDLQEPIALKMEPVRTSP